MPALTIRLTDEALQELRARASREARAPRDEAGLLLADALLGLDIRSDEEPASDLLPIVADLIAAFEGEAVR
jgi:plasmid stability protein